MLLKRSFVFAYFVIMASGIFGNAANSRSTVRVGYCDLPPLIYGTSNMPQGPLAAFIQYVATNEGWHIVWLKGSSATGLYTKLLEQEIDLAVVLPQENGCGTLKFSREAIVSTWGQIYLSSDEETSVQSLADLNGMRIGITHDNIYGDALRKTLTSMGVLAQFLEFTAPDELLRALEARWINAGVVDRFYGAQNEHLYRIVRSSTIVSPMEIRFAAAGNMAPGIIKLLDYHLYRQKHDARSPLHTAITGIVNANLSKTRFAQYLKRMLAAAFILLAASTAFCILLRREVARKTAQLQRANAELRQENQQSQAYLAALKYSNELTEKVLNSMQEALLFLNSECTSIVRVNKAANTIFAASQEQLCNVSPAALFKTNADYERLMSALKDELPQKGFLWTEMVIRRQNGEFFNAAVEISPLQRENGQIFSWVMLVRDVTEQTRMKEELFRSEKRLHMAQKMEALGTLAGGIAHDMNNILTPIICYTEMLLENSSGSVDSQQHQSLQQIFHAAQRASGLVKQILAFSRMRQEACTALPATPVLKEVVQLLRAALPANIEIISDFAAKNDVVISTPTYVHQLLMNLATNAAHAMRSKGGVLRLATFDYKGPVNGFAGFPDLPEGDYFCLSVSDTGHGIPPEIMDAIFDPFFTTKQTGEGTGMGLTVVHKIVKECKGSLQLESTVNSGTVFRIFLPHAEVPASEKKDTITKHSPPPRGKEHILYVDDEPSVAHMAARILNTLGYTTTIAHDGVAALALLRAAPERFALVITDQTMPKLTGTMLAREILHLYPELPIILCSGFHDPAVDADVREKISAFLSKPFRCHELADLVRRTLDHGKRAAITADGHCHTGNNGSVSEALCGTKRPHRKFPSLVNYFNVLDHQHENTELIHN